MTAIATFVPSTRSQAKRDADRRYYDSPKGRANRARKAIKAAAESFGYVCKFPTPETVSITREVPKRDFPSLHAAADWLGVAV